MKTKFKLAVVVFAGIALGAISIKGLNAQTRITTPTPAQSLPKADRAEDVGISSERLKRVTSTFQAQVDNGAIPGAVILIARRGKIAYFEALGFRDRETQAPMQRAPFSALHR
jgi:CubicO group peptidase (beta-lactamase class C family)